MTDPANAAEWADALAVCASHAARIRAQTGTGEAALGPVDIERCFPVACVAVPDLCIGAACRWALRGAGSLPPCLQSLADADSLEAGRPLRGACLAFQGRALLLADEKDDDREQRFSLMHEAAHFFLHHAFPREDAVRRLGTSILGVLDGKRGASYGERFDAALRRADLDFHTHLYRRNAPGRSQAETDADALACLLLAPLRPDIPAPDAEELANSSGIPLWLAARYRAAWQHGQTPPPPRRHGFLARLAR